VSRNPIANPDQFAAEQAVRAMLALPVIREARTRAEQHWRVAYGEAAPTPDDAAFAIAMDEYVGIYLFKAAASDGAHPRFVRNFMPPFRWRGTGAPAEPVPGARMGGDNPDNCYRLAGIAHGGRYRVRVVPVDGDPAHVSFTLTGNWGTSVTIQTLELHDLEREADGSATITIDAEPAGVRPNHLTTAREVKFLFVRDSMADWAAETPLDLTIERLDASAAAPLGIEQMAERAAFRLLEEVPLYYWFQRLSMGKPANHIAAPIRTAAYGGLVTQATAIGHLSLREDMAAIITFDPAGARYCSVDLVGPWYQSIDAHERQSGLTAAMARPNPDGTITCVASTRDPGIANWLDTGGFVHTLPLIRWQGLPPADLRAGPRFEMELVPIQSLAERLPLHVERIDGARRNAQLAARRRAFDRRIST
jgi:hypothetical protein